MRTSTIKLALALLMAGVSATATQAHADVLFDSQALAQPFCSGGGFCIDETRNSGGTFGNYAAVLSFSQDVTVSQIGLWTTIDNDQNIKFLIFDSQLNGGTGALLLSDEKFFAADPTHGYKYSDTIDFTFQAGHTYDVGVLGDSGTVTGSWIGGQNLTDGPITEISNNANITDFANPSTGSYAGVSPYIQLISGTDVPEPTTMALLGAGLAGLGFVRRKKA